MCGWEKECTAKKNKDLYEQKMCALPPHPAPLIRQDDLNTTFGQRNARAVSVCVELHFIHLKILEQLFSL